MKSYLQNNDTKISSIVAERFIRTLKNKIDKYMTSVSKNIYFNKLSGISDKFNNACHWKIKVQAIDLTSSTYIDLEGENRNKYPKFKDRNHVKIPKHKKNFEIG